MTVVTRNVGEDRAGGPEVPPEVREVVEMLVSSLGDDLQAIVWQGSGARGERTAESDHDLIIVMKRLSDDLLLKMRGVFEGREKWSTFVQTQEELRQYPPVRRLQFHHGVVPLYGEFDPPAVTREGLEADLRLLASEIRFESRYRLLNKAPSGAQADAPVAAYQRRRNVNMLHYALKWAVLALKARELAAGRPYPETRKELQSRLAEPSELAILDIVERWPELRPGFEEDITPLALRLDAFARELVRQLEENDD